MECRVHVARRPRLWHSPRSRSACDKAITHSLSLFYVRLLAQPVGPRHVHSAVVLGTSVSARIVSLSPEAVKQQQPHPPSSPRLVSTSSLQTLYTDPVMQSPDKSANFSDINLSTTFPQVSPHRPSRSTGITPTSMVPAENCEDIPSAFNYG